MKLTSMHTHTEFCDGSGTVEEYCAAAHEKKISAIGFSAHAPVEKAGITSDWHLREARAGAYFDAVRAAKEKWAPEKLAVFAGYEIDWIPGRMGPADPEYRALDFTVGSLHYLPAPGLGEELLTVDGPEDEFLRLLHAGFRGDPDALVSAYWRAVLELIEAGGSDILGHIDLIKKNNPGDRYFSRKSAAYREGWEKCVESLGQNGKIPGKTPPVVEINTGALVRGRGVECYPADDILAALVRAEIPLTITCDAHAPDHLGGYYGEALAALKRAGASTVLVFTGAEKNGAPPWRAETLPGV